MKKITKFLKEIGRNEHIDWILVLCVSIAVTAFLAIGGFSLYNAVVRGSVQGNETAPSATGGKLNEKVISSVIKEFDDRLDTSTKARAGYSGPSDPSI